VTSNGLQQLLERQTGVTGRDDEPFGIAIEDVAARCGAASLRSTNDGANAWADQEQPLRSERGDYLVGRVGIDLEFLA
jgi:hypothetical protein